jgi:hypothetical protein
MFAYWPETAQCSRHCAVCLGLCLGRHCPPPPHRPRPPWGCVCPEGGISLIGSLVLFAFFRAPCCFSLAFRLPARSLCASVFRSHLLLFLSCCPSHSPSCCILPHPRFAPLVGPAAAAAPAASAAPVAPPVAAAMVAGPALAACWVRADFFWVSSEAGSARRHATCARSGSLESHSAS